jgi:molybdate transport system substrate-binding protein
LVPAELHAALKQDAVLLQRGAGSAAAQAFMKFLRGREARAIIRAHGYED